MILPAPALAQQVTYSGDGYFGVAYTQTPTGGQTRASFGARYQIEASTVTDNGTRLSMVVQIVAENPAGLPSPLTSRR